MLSMVEVNFLGALEEEIAFRAVFRADDDNLQDVLQDVIAKVERIGGFPLGAVLKELVKVLPV